MKVGSSINSLVEPSLTTSGSGYVRAIGRGVTVAKVGDPVLLSYSYCNDCRACKDNKFSHCTNFAALNFGGPTPVFFSEGKEKADLSGSFFGQSSFASYSIVRACSVVNAKDLVKNDKELALFAPLGCGIQTGCGSTISAAQAQPKDTVVVLGLGGVGLSSLMGANIIGCSKIIGVDRVASRLELARELGATDVIDTSKLGDKSLADALRSATGGYGPTITIETTGVPALVEAAIEAAANMGKVVQVGSTPPDFNLSINVFPFMLRGVQYIGAIEGQVFPPDFVPKMVQWYREGKLPIDKMSKTMAAKDFGKALHEMHDGSTIKPILVW